jgi:hypothetical protein
MARCFVNDAELGLNDFWDGEHYPELQDMLDDFEKAVQKWERLLFTSGGPLELSKCLWYGREQETMFDNLGSTLDLMRGRDKANTTTIK